MPDVNTGSSDGDGGFRFDFTLPSGVHKYFTGKFDEAIPAWTGSDFVLTPADGTGTSGAYDIQSGSTVGTGTVDLNLINTQTGKTITITKGNVYPAIDKVYPVQGGGSWSVASRPK